ncbi:MAG TPA: hypothetical protein VGG45_16230 [Terracidiphilus sp.]|jgi:hypothetical protein
MAVATAVYKHQHDKDPKTVIFDALKGLIEKVEPNGPDYMVCVYERPNNIDVGGGKKLWMPDNASRLSEDKFQGNVGLIVKAGPLVNDYAHRFKGGVAPQVGDWVGFNAGDAVQFVLGERMIRLLKADFVRFTLTDPDCVI